MTAEALGSEEEIKRRDDKDKGEKAEEDKIPLAREGAVSIHAPPHGKRRQTMPEQPKRFNHEFCRTDLAMTGITSFSSMVKGQNVRSIPLW